MGVAGARTKVVQYAIRYTLIEGESELFEYMNQNSLYVVLTIALTVWLGIYGYLFRLDKRLKELEKQNKNQGRGS